MLRILQLVGGNWHRQVIVTQGFMGIYPIIIGHQITWYLHTITLQIKWIFIVNNSTTNPIVGATTIAQTWQNIVMTRSGNTWSIYINNILISTTTNTASID